MDPLYLRKLRIDRQLESQQLKNLKSQAENTQNTTNQKTSNLQNTSTENVNQNQPQKELTNLNSQTERLMKDMRDEILTPKQMKMNYLASMERSNYVKKMMNLPRTLPELLIQLQNPNLAKGLHNIMQNNIPEPDTQRTQTNKNDKTNPDGKNKNANTNAQENEFNSNEFEGFNDVLQKESDRKQAILEKYNVQQKTTNNVLKGGITNNNDKNTIKNNDTVVNNPNQNIDEDFSQDAEPPKNNLINNRPKYDGNKPTIDNRPNDPNDRPPIDNRPNRPNDRPPIDNRPNRPNDRPPIDNRPNNPNDRPPIDNRPNNPNDRPPIDNRPNSPDNRPPIDNRPNRPNDRPPIDNRPNRPNDRPPIDNRPNRTDDRPPIDNRPNRPNDRPPIDNRPNRPNDRPPIDNRPNHPNDRPPIDNRPNRPDNRPPIDNRPNHPNDRPPIDNRPNHPNDRPPIDNRPNRPDDRPPIDNRPNRPDDRPPIDNRPNRPNYRPPIDNRPNRPDDRPPIDNRPNRPNDRPSIDNRPMPDINNRPFMPDNRLPNDLRPFPNDRRPPIHEHRHRHELPPEEVVSTETSQETEAAANLYANLSMNDVNNPTITQMRQRLTDDAFELLFTGLINLNDLSDTIKHNGKDARSKLILAMANASRQGIDNSQLASSMQMVSESMAAEENNPASILKNIIMLYLPWYPLQEGVGFNLAIETMPNSSDFSSLLKVFIQTRNYGNVNGSLILMSGNTVDMNIQCDDKFPKTDLLDRMKEVTQNHSIQSNITVEQKAQMYNEMANQQAKVNLSSTYELNPFLLLMAHSFIKNTIIIDSSANA